MKASASANKENELTSHLIKISEGGTCVYNGEDPQKKNKDGHMGVVTLQILMVLVMMMQEFFLSMQRTMMDSRTKGGKHHKQFITQ